MKPIETVEVTDTKVGCDGGGGALGHPLVYLTLDRDGVVECPYCSRRFVLKAEARQAAHH
ncbi:MAG: zinc-finger domain-containing protein [Azospirillaceae bacterium]|nr:zinc-finger domain-containing protein [Azospirillaceae bacterium]